MPVTSPSVDDLERLETLRGYSLLDTLPEQEYDDITALASYLCGTPVSVISLIDEDRQWFKSKVGLDFQQTPRSESFCAHTIGDGKTLIVKDARLDARFAENPLVLGQPGIRFYMGVPLIAPNGKVMGTVCVIDTEPRDMLPAQVSALEALSRQVMALFESRLRLIEVEKAAAALMQAEKLAAVGRLAASMAHEINNPLEAVTNLLYLSREYAVEPRVKSWLGDAELELRRISAIANQALRFHKQSSKAQPATCASLISETLGVYEARLKNARITVELRSGADHAVRCFEGDIRQVLGVIVSNAVDAMPNGGRLLIRSREGRDWQSGRMGVVLILADTGVGIDRHARPRVFEAFYTTKGIGGIGLGLWVSAEIMRRHQGKISIKSSTREGASGTVVTLFLPFAGVDVQ